MADQPGAKQSTTVDRTSALVAGGLALLAVIGVASVFSETIAAAWSPAAGASATVEPAPGGAPASPASPPAASPASPPAASWPPASSPPAKP